MMYPALREIYANTSDSGLQFLGIERNPSSEPSEQAQPNVPYQ